MNVANDSIGGFLEETCHLLRELDHQALAGASTISLVGFDGGVMGRDSTVSILVPVASTPQEQAIHLVIEHLLMSLLKQALGGSLDER